MAESYHRSLFRRIVGGFFAWFGFIVLVLIVVGVVAKIWLTPGGPAIGDATVLTLDLTDALADGRPTSSLEHLLLGAKPSLRQTIEAIDAAGKDSRVKGLVAQLGTGRFQLAQIQELRDAVAGFRANGKFAYAYADSFGEMGGGTGSYYLATAFDQIWLQPFSELGLVGLRAEQPFFHDALDKAGITAHFDHREEFKTAMSMFTDKVMSAAQREETQDLLNSLFGQIVRGIGERRHLAEGDVRTLVDRGPFFSDDAVKTHLLDHLGGRDDVFAAARAKAGGKDTLLSVEQYGDQEGPPHRSGPVIAVIDADGLILSGSSSPSPFTAAAGVGADDVARAFREATTDSQVRAIVFRIDSPGGSAVASETIWEATLRAKKAGKPLVVSMGDLAASGGYYIASNADTIVAEPGTLTGSIGVVGGKFAIGGLSDKLGIGWDSVQVGANAGLSSVTQDFSPEGYARLQKLLDNFYAGFKSRVAQGRKFDAVKVESVAKGRVWTGEEARANGLVDALGGFDVALDLAKHSAGIAIDSDVTLKRFPRETRTLWARIFDRTEAGAMLAMLHPYLQTLLLMTAPPGALTMQPLWIQ
ncbi:MAG TPA: signal peptide peptidase SppA [Stellaceae bacterium]|jgi:protease-4|nr:signal peptide peptidase SppA [Stellaceae bacterium]